MSGRGETDARSLKCRPVHEVDGARESSEAFAKAELEGRLQDQVVALPGKVVVVSDLDVALYVARAVQRAGVAFAAERDHMPRCHARRNGEGEGGGGDIDAAPAALGAHPLLVPQQFPVPPTHGARDLPHLAKSIP